MSPRRACALLGVIDSDTVRVEWEGRPRAVRLLDVCPEKAKPGSTRPPTAFGRKTHRWLRDRILKDADRIEIDALCDPPAVSNSGKILAYAFHQGQNINLRMVSEGYSPCFEKYGYPLSHCREMYEAEHRARFEGRGIWGRPGAAAEYRRLKEYWTLRAGQVEAFRHALWNGEDVFDTRLHYAEIIARAGAGAEADLFCEISGCFHIADGSTLMQLGNPQQPLCAFFSAEVRELAGHVRHCYAGEGRATYFCLSGRLGMTHNQPQICIERLEQISPCPPKTSPQLHTVEA